MKPNQIRYASSATKTAAFWTMCSSTAGTADGTRRISMVVNASNREKIVAWLKAPTAGMASHCSTMTRRKRR